MLTVVVSNANFSHSLGTGYVTGHLAGFCVYLWKLMSYCRADPSLITGASMSRNAG